MFKKNNIYSLKIFDRDLVIFDKPQSPELLKGFVQYY